MLCFCEKRLRHEAENLLGLANAGMPTPRSFRGYRGSGANFSQALWTFLLEEKPIAASKMFKIKRGRSLTGFPMTRAYNKNPKTESKTKNRIP